jgi:putative nucleotidyltransferase with HDIG domain
MEPSSAVAHAVREFGPLPISAVVRDRLLEALRTEQPAGDVAHVVEGDLALLAAVMRAGNRRGFDRGCVDSVPAALAALSPGTLRALADSSVVHDFFAADPTGRVPLRELHHARAVQGAAHRLAEAVGFPALDRVAVIAGLHDIGRLVLRALPDPGVDHAAAGALLLRHWGLPERIAGAVERHHAPDAHEEAAIVGLADALVHFREGRTVEVDAVLARAHTLGITEHALAALAHDLPSGPVRRVAAAINPLSEREVAVLRKLAEGKVYKEIAGDLGLSPNTVRSHLHRVYRRIGATDRAQAVLISSRHGWL